LRDISSKVRLDHLCFRWKLIVYRFCCRSLRTMKSILAIFTCNMKLLFVNREPWILRAST
jgi:hypothetical protein